MTLPDTLAPSVIKDLHAALQGARADSSKLQACEVILLQAEVSKRLAPILADEARKAEATRAANEAKAAAEAAEREAEAARQADEPHGEPPELPPVEAEPPTESRMP